MMETRRARTTARKASTMDESDSALNDTTTAEDTANLAPRGHASPILDDHFSDNSSSSKRIKLENETAISKFAIASMVEDPNSPLAEANLRAILSEHVAFDSLRQDQKEHLMAMLPSRDTITDEFGNRRPSDEFLLSNPDWAQNIGAFQDDLKEGRFDPQWVAEAMEAHQQRQAGVFDEYKEGEYESFWGQRQKLSSNIIAGLSSDVKLCDLFRKDILKVGDMWSFARTFGKKESKSRVLIEKEMMVRDVAAGQPTLVFPTGQAKLSHPGREDVVLTNVTGPGQAVTAVLETDGRITNAPNGNAWKSIRVLRNNQDLGTLWDIRQAYHFKDREGEFKSAINGTPYRSHRAASGQTKQGLVWANPFTAVFQQVRLTNISQQPPATLHIQPEFQAALNDIAFSGATLVRVDYRVMIRDGLPVPMQPGTEELVHDIMDDAWVDKMLQVGSDLFPTAFTRALASEHGPSWSHGHAHLGADALGAVWSATAGKKGFKRASQQQNEDHGFGIVPVPVTDIQRDRVVRLLDANPSWIPQRQFMQFPHLYTESMPAEREQQANWHTFNEVSRAVPQSMISSFSGSQPDCFLDFASLPKSTNLLSYSRFRDSVTANQTASIANPSEVQQIGFVPPPAAQYDEFGIKYYEAYSPGRGNYRTIYPPIC